MNINERQGHRLVERGLVRRDQVGAAWEPAHRGVARDLCAVLVLQGALSPELAEQVRRECSGGAASSPGLPAISAPGDPLAAVKALRAGLEHRTFPSGVAPPTSFGGSEDPTLLGGSPTSSDSEARTIRGPESRPFITPAPPSSSGSFESSGSHDLTVRPGPGGLPGSFGSEGSQELTVRPGPGGLIQSFGSEGSQELTVRPGPGLAPGLAASAHPVSSDPAAVFRDAKAALAGDPLLAFHAESCLVREGKLGAGGMGVVYRATDRRLGRRAAQKVLLDDSEEQRERFLREARITARLDHPAIPPVYELGKTAAGELFLLMRVIEGRTLQELIESYREAPDEATLRTLLGVLVKVGEAVAYAHSRGILHRDLKPANVMVGAYGEVLVMDWGLAKDQSENADLARDLDRPINESLDVTQDGAILGTLGFMPPEQLDGEVDERADVFALGAMLTVLLTGRPPIDGESNINRMKATAEAAIAIPSERDPGVPRELDWVAAGALEGEPEDRTESALVFVAQLRAYVAGADVPGFRYSKVEAGLRAVRRRPASFVGAASLLLLLTLGATVWLNAQRSALAAAVTLSRAENEAFRAKEAEQAALAAEQAALAAKEQARRETAEAREAEALAKKVPELLQQARNAIARGADAEAVTRVEEALALSGRRAESLATAADIYRKGSLRAERRALLKELVRNHPPAYDALYQLHTMVMAETFSATSLSEPIRQLIAEVRRRGDENAFRWFAEGFESLRTADNEAAIRSFSKAITAAPGLTLARYLRSEAYIKLDKLTEAARDLEAVIATDPKFALAHHNLGVLAARRGRHKQAVGHYDDTIALAPNFTMARYSRAVARQRLGDVKGAWRDLDVLLALEPDHVDGRTFRGKLRLEAKDFAGALEDLDRAIELDASNTMARHNRAVVHAHQREPAKALADLDEVLKLEPTRRSSMGLRGELLMTLSRFKEAEAALTEMIRLDDTDPEAFDSRARLRARMRREQDALADISRAIALAPREPRFRDFRAGLRMRTKDFGGAMEDCNEGLAIAPRSPPLLEKRGRLFHDSEQQEPALRDLTLAVTLEPRWSKARLLRAAILQEMKRYPEALEDFNLVVRLDPGNALAYGNRGFLLADMKSYRAALTDLREFLRMAPRHPGGKTVRDKIAELEALMKADSAHRAR